MAAAKINPDLQEERDAKTFDTDQLTYILDGGEGMTNRRREVERMALKDLEQMKGPNYHYLSRPEKYSESVRKSVHYMKKVKELKFDTPADSYWYRKEGNSDSYSDEDHYYGLLFPNENAAIGLHGGMFVPSIESMSTEEQKKRWLAAANSFKFIGTYAQTEMGHGTYLRGLETTATYDPATEEFVLHSPTLSSSKWWPGGLGKTSNYAVVMAILYTKGKNCGMQPFMVQLRSLEDHKPLPGITLGDIGPKFGYETIDNGFLRFDHVRIPRENMMMKNARVEKDGTFMKTAKNERLSYGTMIFVRAMIVLDVAARGLAQASTIAIRYSCVRRQSELKPGEREPKVLEFQTQQYKLLPQLASAYAYWFSGLYMRSTYFQVNYEIQQGNVELLPELHAVSAGLKAFTTYGANFGIEQCRLSCGGHGYSQASGIPKIYVTATPGCTYEGENTVLFLQTARYLMKAYNASQKGEKTTGSAAYLSEPMSQRCELTAKAEAPAIVEAYKHRAARLVRKAGEGLAKRLASGKPYHDAWNETSVQLVRASEAHCHFFVVRTFAEQVEATEQAAIKQVLSELFQLYSTYGITQNAAEFIEDGHMSRQQLDALDSTMITLLGVIRRNAVALVDAFDFTDNLLGSALGRYDGNVYEALYKFAIESPLNETEVHESYEKYLRPLMNEGKSKL